MIVAGIDVGNETVKAVILDEDVLSYSIIPSDEESKVSAERVLRKALEAARLSREEIKYIIATGVEEGELEFIDGHITDVGSAIKGAHFLFPSARTVINMGAETCVVATFDENGVVVDYTMNQKCGAGTGMFFEVVADALEVKLEDIGALARRATKDIEITSSCAVFAESEVVSLVSVGTDKADILKGIDNAIASRTAAMIKTIGLHEDVAIIGGVARNAGLIDALEKQCGVHLLVPETPEIVGALGAALAARERAVKEMVK